MHLPFSWTFASSRVFSATNSLLDLARISLYKWDSFEYSPPSALSLTALTVSVTLTVRLLSFPDELVIFIQIRGTDPRDVNFWSSNSLIFPRCVSSPNFCKTTLRFVTQSWRSCAIINHFSMTTHLFAEHSSESHWPNMETFVLD